MKEHRITVRHPIRDIRLAGQPPAAAPGTGDAESADVSPHDAAGDAACPAQRIHESLENLSLQVKELELKRSRSLNELQVLTVELAVTLAERLTQQTFDERLHDVQRLVATATEECRHQRPIVIRLNPDDLQQLQAQLSESQWAAYAADMVELQSDDRLTCGDCQADLADYSLRFDWRHQLQELRTRILQGLKMLKLNVEQLKQTVTRSSVFQNVGKLHSARGTLAARMPASLNEVCCLQSGDAPPIMGEVVGFDRGLAQIMPYDSTDRPPSEGHVVGLGRRALVPCGPSLLGRVLDGLGRPIDGHGPLPAHRQREVVAHVPPALFRQRIDTPLITGQRAVDGLLTLGLGQRVGLFAGSGVGKSTLLGEIAKYSNVQYNVIALVGERGREVRPFIEDCLGPEGLRRSVVVVSTSNESPLMRVRAVQSAITIADEFRQAGGNVLFLLDSATRLAMAQRELGLSLGEPPTSRGYTPSVFQLLASTLEQLGNSETGSITALTTVLVDADDMNDPIADAVRSIVDGHIVLSRELAERGHFPAIDVGGSLSRVFPEVTSATQQSLARRLRSILATFYSNVDLIRAGAYQPGSAAEIDAAIQLVPRVEAFLRQDVNEFSTLDDTLRRMEQVTSSWGFG